MLPPGTHTVGAAPFALRSPVKLRIKADKVVGTRAGVAQNNFPTLLAHLTVILVIRLVAINLFLPGHCRTAQDCQHPGGGKGTERKKEGLGAGWGGGRDWGIKREEKRERERERARQRRV